MSEEEEEQNLQQQLLKEQDQIFGKYIKNYNSYEKANIFSKLLFTWVTDFVKLGNKTILEQDMHDPLIDKDKSNYLYYQFSTNWKKHSQKSKHPVYRSLASSFQGQIILCLMLQFFVATIDLLRPVVIQQLIIYVGSDERSFSKGFGYLCIVISVLITLSILSMHSEFQFNKLGYCMNNSVILALFDKCLKISLFSTKNYKPAEIINMAQVDCGRLYSLFNQLSNMIFLPLQLIIGLIMLYYYIGISLVAGLLTILILSSINFFLTKIMIKQQKQLMKDKDGRMKAVSEVLSLIKFIKVNAWEEIFYQKIDEKRNKEINTLRKRAIVQIFQTFLSWLTSPLIYNSVFAWYTLSNNILTAEIAFPVITLFNVLQGPIQSIPSIIQSLVETNNSVDRIQKFLLIKELDLSFIKSSHLKKDFDKNLINQKEKKLDHQKTDFDDEEEQLNSRYDTFSNENQQIEQQKYTDFAIVVKNGNFSWGVEELEQKQDKLTKKQKKELKKLKKQEAKAIKQLQKAQNQQYINENQGKFEQINFKESDISSYQESFVDESNRQTEIQPAQNSIQKIDKLPKILKNINLEIPKGKMVAFIGDVGAGKSSFFYSLLGEMLYDNEEQLKFTQEGEQLLQQNPQVYINGSISLVNQKPWMLSDTIENNILFGKPLNRQRYEQTIHKCCLTHDFTVLQKGDQTIIGEQGINLSGGQKARISLARAVYSDSDILLLDDILSAVDVHVGQKIMKDCMTGYLKDKTRVLITHALYYMKYMDYIYLMDNGEIIEQGTYDEMKKSQQFKKVFEKIMRKNSYDSSENFANENDVQKQQEKNFIILGRKIDEQIQKQAFIQTKNSQDIQETLMIQFKKENLKSSDKKNQQNIEQQQQQKGKLDDLFVKEDRNKGKVSMIYYWLFAKYNGGIIYTVAILFFSLFSQSIRIMSIIWIGIWTDKSTDPDYDQSENNYYLTWFTILSLSISMGTLFRASVAILCNFRCIIQLHQQMMVHLIYAPLNEFFDRIPQGRILNRLSKDINILDTQLPMSISAMFVSGFGVVGTIFLCAYAATPYILIPTLIFFYICYLVYKYYMKCYLEIVRLESITKSPVVSFFNETLMGLHSIRAYNRQSDFINKQYLNIDENKKNQIMLLSTNIWFKIMLSLLSLIINVTSISFCVFAQYQDSSNTGLVLTYSLNMDMIIRWFLMKINQTEEKFVSFERCYAYLSVESEKGYKEFLNKRPELIKKKQPLHNKIPELENWPQKGVIEFKDVYVRYRENLETVLNGLTFKVESNQKIGIVGRTGAGKSTITLCILRILELLKGQIIIDGQDISLLSLDELRSKITIILQDPSLFQGTLRKNLDPLGELSDSQLIDTMNKCNLGRFLQEREGLDTQIQDGGGNLSVGEKQLICIARALLKKSKVVLIDEATANIDIQTEQMIQETIKVVFKGCTVLTIAHRINTILESDKILVMDNGQLSEFDSPQTLLQNPNSLFYSLHQQALKEHNL